MKYTSGFDMDTPIVLDDIIQSDIWFYMLFVIEMDNGLLCTHNYGASANISSFRDISLFSKAEITLKYWRIYA